MKKEKVRDNSITHTYSRSELYKSSEQDGARASTWQLLTSWRWVVALLLHASHLVGSLPRFSLGIAMICMVKSPDDNNNTLTDDDENRIIESYSIDENHFLISRNSTAGGESIGVDEKEFSWDPGTVGLLLAAPNFLQFLGPFAADTMRRLVGNKLCMMTFMAILAVTSFLAPLAARSSPYLLLAVIMYQGVMRTTNAPVIGEMLAHWAPQAEKLTLSAFVFVGANVAGVIGNFLSGFLCSIPVDNGWPFIFYFIGILAMIWVMLWVLLVSKSPDDHKYISYSEKAYIVANRKGMDNLSRKEPTPYKAMLSSGPVWGFLIVGTCFMWVMTATFAYLPMFYNRAQGFTEEQTGVMMAAIGVIRILGTSLWAGLGNALMRTRRVTTAQCRKLCVISGMTGAALLQFLNCALTTWANRWAVFGVQCLVFLCDAVGSATITVMPLDLAPRYASFLSAIWLTMASSVAMSGPLLIGYITPTNSLEEWRIVWVIFGCVFVVGAFAFLFLGQSSLQPWAVPTESDSGYPSGRSAVRRFKRGEKTTVEKLWRGNDTTRSEKRPLLSS